MSLRCCMLLCSRNQNLTLRVIGLLAKKKMGMTRLELLEAGGFDDNGSFSDILNDLEWCGFIRSYTMMGYRNKSEIYQLIDHYTLFYYEFINGQRQGANYWKTMLGTPKYNTWCGLAFERACLWHTDQIKKHLGISGILTNEYTWRCSSDEMAGRRGVQIDLLIDRSDGIIDICEMKYSKDQYAITSDYSRELVRKREVFVAVTGTRKAIHSVMVTAEGVVHNAEWGEIQAEVTMDDLYE